MIGRLLRHLLEPLAITTGPAPLLAGGHVDVTADAASIVDRSCTYVVPTEQPREWVPLHFETDVPVVVAAEPELDYVDDRPAIDRGTCYHDLHIDLAGVRTGLSIDADGTKASLPPCPYLGKAGR